MTLFMTSVKFYLGTVNGKCRHWSTGFFTCFDMISLVNAILSLKPFDLQCNDSSIFIAIALAALFYPDAVNIYAEILMQQIF